MSARHANRRKSNCCDTIGCCSISVHPCQCEIGRCDSLGADFSGCRSFAVGRGRGLRFGFAIGRPNGIASRPIECRITSRVLTTDTKRTGRIHAASVLASRAPLLAGRAKLLATQAKQAKLLAAQPLCAFTCAAQDICFAQITRAAQASLRAEVATEHSPTPRVRINFFEAIYFRFGASGRLSTAMIDASQQMIGSNGIRSTGDVDRASDCADVSARWDASTPLSSLRSRDDRRFNRSPSVARSGAPSGSHPTERAA